MDYATFAGLALAIAGVIGGQLLEGGHVGSLLQGAAFVIVFCGTLGAVMIQTPLAAFADAVRISRWAIVPPPALRPEEVIGQIVGWANLVRREGVLALESRIRQMGDLYTRKGLQLLVDGAGAAQMHEVMQIEIVGYEERMRRAARVWEAAGGYAPTIGILGAVLGLIHVMENLTDPARLGSGIAVAFVATIYGIGLANLVFLPLSNKLKVIVARQVLLREVLLDGLISIANGENPRVIAGKLEGYLQ
jgi:chemotaxis protein MotA